MKNKILSLILVLMLLPMASLFSACKKQDETDLTMLDDNFYNIANENNNIKVENGKLFFDYSSHEKMSALVASTEPYSELNKYNEIYENLMSFTCSYIDNCSIKDKVITKEVKEDVENDLNEFSKAMQNVNANINTFSEIVIVAEADVTNYACVAGFENLLNSYYNLFQTSINLNNSLNDLYFNKIVNNSNPDIYSEGVNNFNSSLVISKLESRIKSQISSLTESFVEMYVDGGLAERIAKKEATFDLNYNDYKNNVKLMLDNQDVNEDHLTDRVNANKTAFYNLAVKAQNIQATQNNNRQKFITACNGIEYALVNGSTQATEYQKLCARIIEENQEMIAEYNSVLNSMINIGK